MRDDDLAPFAVADGLLTKMGTGGGWRLTQTEIEYLVEHARDNCARVFGVDPDTAVAAMATALEHGDLVTQASKELAAVTAWGRVLVVMTRHELRGICHPERN